MNVVEKIAYTKGFFSGLNIDDNTKEGKAFNALLALLEELVVSNADLEQQCAKLKAQVSEIDEHVSEVFNNVFDNASYENDNQDSLSTDMFEVICPQCNTRTTFNQSVASQGHMSCPGCGINLEFDYDDSQLDSAVFNLSPADNNSPEEFEQPVIDESDELPFETAAQAEELEEVQFPEMDLPGVNFSTAPPVPTSGGEDDMIPQTEDFVYSESTEDFEGTLVMPFNDDDVSSDSLDADKSDDNSKSALVKVDFVADPAAFEAGKKKSTEYRFSEKNVKTDFSKLVPDSLDHSDPTRI